MEKEVSAGTKLGVTLIALACIIGLGFGIFVLTRGTTNTGVVAMQENLSAVSDSVFEDYNQKIVTSTQVISAYNNFEGKPIAILIATRAFLNNVATSNPAIVYNDSTSNKNTVQAVDASNNPLKLTESGAIVDVDVEFINYNALLELDAVVKATNGGFTTVSTFNVSDGVSVFNSMSGGLSKSGNSEYIPSSSRFQANILKDTSGIIMGIVFQQVDK